MTLFIGTPCLWPRVDWLAGAQPAGRENIRTFNIYAYKITFISRKNIFYASGLNNGPTLALLIKSCLLAHKIVPGIFTHGLLIGPILMQVFFGAADHRDWPKCLCDQSTASKLLHTSDLLAARPIFGNSWRRTLHRKGRPFCRPTVSVESTEVA